MQLGLRIPRRPIASDNRGAGASPASPLSHAPVERTMHVVARCIAAMLAASAVASAQNAAHTFTIGEQDFLHDGKPIVLRSGEMHAARVPREYWRHRLEMIRAMGCNTVCAYLFWNQHEPQPGQFDFAGQADAAEYCRLAQSVGLHVILRPGPYACAEWDFGGFPWWLLRERDIRLRTRDPRFLDAAQRYLRRVAQQLAPLQVTRGGPILMVQVENEYGSYGSDPAYVGILRDTLRDAGFDVPLFTCDGPSQLKHGARADIFSVVNFGSDPAAAFRTLREIRPAGPLMCGEYYPGWFDSWGAGHHTGDAERVVRELESMLANRQSFSIYMAHGGTSFGFSAGANSPPFRPQTTSYDYDAPIDEAGRPTPKFHALRELFAKHLEPGETLPDLPAANPIITIGGIRLTDAAPLFDNLGVGVPDDRPHAMELYGQPHGLILYRFTLPAGAAGKLTVRGARDIVQAFVDGKRCGVSDRRATGKATFHLPKRDSAATLDLLVEAMGRVNYGPDLHDAKGIVDGVEFAVGGDKRELKQCLVYSLTLDARYLAALRFSPCDAPVAAPTVYRGRFDLTQTGDTFLDMRGWPKGMVWINGRNLGRYWSIGPTQTLYVPGCWLKAGANEIVVLDVFGEATRLTLAAIHKPILDELGLDPLGSTSAGGGTLKLDGLTPAHAGAFADGKEPQTVTFTPVEGRYVCLQALSAQRGDVFTTCGEIALLDAEGNELPRDGWSIAFADSEETDAEDGAAANAIDAQPRTFWHSQWSAAQPKHPHALVIDLSGPRKVAGVRYTPRQDSANGRIKDYRIYVSVEAMTK